MIELTPRQREILELIREHLEAHGHPPTRAEIARRLGFRSANAAESHLRALERKGALELTRGASRGIRLHEEFEGGLPLVGRVAAGMPILAEENIEDRYRLAADLFHPRADYLLRVRGESMRDAGILDGDLLAVHRAAEAEDGRIVVVRLDDEVTVKRFRRRSHVVELLPENPDFEPIRVDLRRRELALEGLAVGVVRTEP